MIVACRNLSKIYKQGNNNVKVLEKIDFSLAANQSVAIMGASGCGKSTLLQLLGGLDTPTSGQVLWHNQDIASLSQRKKCQLLNQHIGFVYQFHHLLAEFSALENVAMPLLIAGITPKAAKKRAHWLLEKVGLASRSSHKMAQLSGGERQRTALARALVARPSCMLADEPTGNLDANTSNQVLQCMLSLQREFKIAIVMATHDANIAKQLSCCYHLTSGQLHQQP